jgi:hypothetical protein
MVRWQYRAASPRFQRRFVHGHCERIVVAGKLTLENQRAFQYIIVR